MRTVRSAARARNRARPRLAWLLLVVVLLLMVLTARLASAESLSTRECDREDDQLDDAVDDGEEEHVYVIEEVVDQADLDVDRGYPFEQVGISADVETDRDYPFEEYVDPPDRQANHDDRFEEVADPGNENHDLAVIDQRIDQAREHRCEEVADAQLGDPAHELPHEREPPLRRGRTWIGRLAGRVDLSLTWRRHLASSGDLHGERNEVWLVGTWRL